MRPSGLVQVFTDRRVAVMLPLGFASGLPLPLTGQTLQGGLSQAGVEVTTIGLLTLVALPYTLKFLWAPLMDRFVPPWLGRRRGWMVATQVWLMFAIGAMALAQPSQAPWLVGLLALLVALTSASQDIVFDAYRADVLPPQERGLGAGVSVTGYRVGAFLVSGALGLMLLDFIGWQATYLVMAGCMLIGVAGTLASPEPSVPGVPPRSLGEAIAGPMREFFARPAAIGLILAIVLYKLGDAFAGSLTVAFLNRGVDFSLAELGLTYKIVGFVATVLGALVGGALMIHLGLFASLLGFGLLQALSNLSFMLLAVTGKSYPIMVSAVAIENLSGGMGTAAFVAFLMALCDHRYTATQYALLSAVASTGRVLVGAPSGYLVEAVGWPAFFLCTFLVALPGLVVLWWIRDFVNKVGQQE